ncbi:phage protease [Laribacter hongkongensis]|uniref:phage protease n=1 Tax=Laribacter hongkongensis TaxID=168471 RepID=UPI001EFEA8A4|nr:phage protease [Laribacter hongkongensis]MCG8991453.1 phage protease [Laribacter hongkongensis]MCG8997709.1 phage protease [Laribacter hongkongensis]MCG9001265.1 phage protease [Laribacter hongkongensis]MCG9003039.1 phage protease [Laribacter hongkongensis]MCG9007473.1 phage protease [Laribacter hongkongensis]
MNATKPLHIFKPGRQTAMSGAVLDFSESDLAASARAYDPALHEAPIVIGHPKHDAPAYGWVKSLAAGGDGLNAEPHQIDADFAELVAAGRYKKISASFYLPDAPNNPVPGVYYLRHVGFLGAQPPAVKGLKQAEFADAEDGVVEFGDWGMETNASLWRRMREWLLAKFDQETADQVVPDWQIESIREAARQDDDAPRAAFADPTDVPVSPTQLTHEENHAVTPEQKAALEAENAQLKQRLAAAEAEKKTAAAAKRHGEHLAYAEQLVGDGKLAPKHKDAVVAFLDFADGETAVEFGEGDTKQPLATAFKSFLGDMPKVVEFGETATKGKAGKGGNVDVAEFAEKSTDPDRLNLHVRATELAAEKGIPYEQAVRQLL